MNIQVGPFKNIPPGASLSTIIKGTVIDDTVLDAVNRWLYNNPGYHYVFKFNTEHGIIQDINLKVQYHNDTPPKGKIIMTRLKPVRLGSDYYNYILKKPDASNYLENKERIIKKDLSSKLDGFKVNYVRHVHRKDEWGKMVETERIIHYDYYELMENIVAKKSELKNTKYYYSIPSIPSDLGFKAKDLAYADSMLSALMRIKKLDKQSLLELKLNLTPNQEKDLYRKLKGYGMEQLVSQWHNQNPINWLLGNKMYLARKLTEKGIDSITESRNKIKKDIQIKCYGDDNLKNLYKVVLDCASTGVMLVANTESGIINPLGIKISNSDVDRHTKEFIDMLKKGQLYKVEGYTDTFIAQAAFNGSLLAIGTSIPLNFQQVINKRISPNEAIGNVIKDISISGISSGLSASIARKAANILSLPPGVNSIISIATGYGTSIISNLIYDLIFDSSKDINQNPPIRPPC